MREQLVERLFETFVQDERVKAVWLGGSQGRGQSDEWSDTDFYVAVEDAAFESFFAEVPERVGRLEKVVHGIDFAFRRQSPTERVWFFFFEGWPVHWKLDFHVHTTASARGADPDQRRELIHCTWHVLHDPERLLSPLPPLPAPEQAAFQAHVQEKADNLAMNFALAATYIRRADFWQASAWLQALHDRVFYLMAIDGNASLMEDAYPLRFAKACREEELALLNGAVFDRDGLSMARAGLQLFCLFDAVGKRFCEKAGALYPARFARQVEAAYREMAE